MAGLVVLSSRLNAQQAVTIPDVGPGPGGRFLRDALRRPHRLVGPDTSWFVLRRSDAVRASLIVLGRTAAIAGKVDGDVIVVGGDLHVRPGAEVSGRAVAIGGGVYPSPLSFIGQGFESFRDATFDVEPTATGYSLVYRSLREEYSAPLLFPFLYGFRFPSYDRVNGASVPFGPTISLADGRFEADAIVTYRSNLGKLDPRLSASYQAGRRSRLELEVQRGTFSNDTWIWSDYVNSLLTLGWGVDTRNYFRADRAELRVYRLWEFSQSQFEPFLGVRGEEAWPVGPTLGGNRAPWSAFRRGDSLGVLRPNPQFGRNDVRSLLAGGRIEWESAGVKVLASSLAERGIVDEQECVGLCVLDSFDFTQITSDLTVGFPTFGEQEYQIDVHWVTSPGQEAPVQRFAYLGGQGTLPFLNLLEQGGDELLLVDQRYAIPLPNVRAGILGVPTLQFRHRLGSAGIGKLPDFEQMLGAGVSLTVIRAEAQLDPSSGKWRFGGGFTFSR